MQIRRNDVEMLHKQQAAKNKHGAADDADAGADTGLVGGRVVLGTPDSPGGRESDTRRFYSPETSSWEGLAFHADHDMYCVALNCLVHDDHCANLSD